MPEGDTVLRTARGLHRALADRLLTGSELRWGRLGDRTLAGRTVVGTVAYGKNILTRIAPATPGAGPRLPSVSAGALTLHSHLRMDGSWRIHRTGTRRLPGPSDPEVRAILVGEEWTAVGHRLGMLHLVPTNEEHTLLGHLGPDIMADDWDATGRDEALRRLAELTDRPIGEVLLDQHVTAGIGTLYMAEALFVRGISPWLPAGDTDAGPLLDTARKLLLRGADQVVPNTTGDPRKGQTSYAHARSGRPCRRCGTIIRVAPVRKPPTERPAFYCPRCQPGPAPTDTGSDIAPLGSAPHRVGSTRNQGLRPPRPGWLG